ncbi:MAG: relaxase domain-containing protein [Streptomyces sp.]|uniref:MobF family relaxase n=1 Tax=Streptomyces sp. TaxID=1931 RepID=UPI0025FB8E7F|nr:MobF family relaxase [Streptomyces sp.]MBW8801077.1 relaxase domain-containing protein [Streptomyces sp.]
MISVCMLGGAGGGDGRQLGRYYRHGAACEAELEQLPDPGLDVPGLDELPEPVRAEALRYYAKAEELAAARWVGDGAAAFGLTGRVDDAGMTRFAELLDGRLDGEQVARPVWRESATGHLDVATLLDALEAHAEAQGTTVEGLFAGNPAAAATYAGLQRRTAGGRDWVRPETALELCLAAGLDVSDVYRSPDGTDRYLEASMRTLERDNVRRVGIDVTVSAPKSVSTLAAVTTNAQAVDAIMRCHTLATNEALSYLQRHAGHAFRGHHGDGQQMATIGTAGWIGAAFTHHTSRADDPQLHTHLVIANVLQGDDGRWSAVDSRAVFRHAKTAGYLYQAALRHHLSEQLGVTFTEPVKGVAEIEGIPREVLQEFSTRRRDILTALNGAAPSGPAADAAPVGVLSRGRRRAAQAACLATRPVKTHRTSEQLRPSWRDRAAQHGLPTLDHLLRLPDRAHDVAERVPDQPGDRAPGSPSRSPAVHGWSRPSLREVREPATGTRSPASSGPLTAPAEPAGLPHGAATVRPSMEQLAGHLFGPAGLTANKTDFDTRDVVQALCELLPPTATGDAFTVEWLAARLLDHPDAIRLDPDQNGGAERGLVYSSRDLVSTEHRALTLAAIATRAPAADRQALTDALARTGAGLSSEQRAAVLKLAADPRLATVLVGPAGSGKTATLATLHTYWAAQQRPALGVALAALTAQRLQADSGIPSRSVAALLHHLDTPDRETGRRPGLPAGAVVVVDEAGMVGTRGLTRLLEHTHSAGGSLLLVGDPAQLGEIDAGGLFRHLAQPALRPAELSNNQRQTHPWEQRALLDLRHGHTRSAVDGYASHDRIRTAPDRDTLLAQLADDYLKADRTSTIVLATRRDDVAALNSLIRTGLQATGRLPADTLVLHDTDGRPLPLAVGDQLLNTRNLTTAAGRKLLNGTRLTVTAAVTRGVTVDDGTDRHVLDTATAGAVLQHGYATTIHKAQGGTVDHALVLADDLTAHAAYTALSRGRHTNVLYRTSDGDPREQLIKDLQVAGSDRLALPRVAQPSRHYEPVVELQISSRDLSRGLER